MAYFDQAATTYPKPECVYTAMDQFNRFCGGSAGRGAHKRSSAAAALIADTRTLIQQLLHCPNKQVVFVPTATIALNIIIQGVIETGVHNVYISPFEHNAVTRTLTHYEKLGRIRVEQLAVSQELEFDFDDIRAQFAKRPPHFVIASHVSNTIGLITPVQELFQLAKEHGAITLVDMAQSAGLIDFNAGLNTVDYAVFAGHKTLLGPTGISGFVMKPDLILPAILFGGTGYDSANQDMPTTLPERFEIGTVNTLAIAGLNASIRWLMESGIEQLRKVEDQNRNKLLSILNNYDFLNVVGVFPGREYVGIVSCIVDGISSESAGMLLNNLGIEVRAGLQCAPLAHRFIDTYPAGTVRFSVNAMTTDEDFYQLENALATIEDSL